MGDEVKKVESREAQPRKASEGAGIGSHEDRVCVKKCRIFPHNYETGCPSLPQ